MGNGKGKGSEGAYLALIPGKAKLGDIVTSVLPPGSPATISIVYVKAPLPTAVRSDGELSGSSSADRTSRQ